jgi:hypothetical protein
VKIVKTTESTKKRGKSWLSRQLGVTPQRVTALIGENRIPNRASYTDAEVKAAKLMLQEARSVANGTAGSVADDQIAAISRNPYKIAQIKLLVERQLLLAQRRMIEAGEFLRKSDVEREQVHKVLAVRTKLAEFPLRATLLVGRSESEIAATLESWVIEVCNHFAAGGGDELVPAGTTGLREAM